MTDQGTVTPGTARVQAVTTDARWILLVGPGTFDVREELGKIPGTSWSNFPRGWKVPRSPLAARAVVGLFPWLASDRVLGELSGLADPARRMDPSLSEPLPFTSTFGAPWEHQVRGARWLARNPAALLRFGLGTGKTRAALDAIRLVGAKVTVVAAPRKVVEVWEREVQRHHPDYFRVLPLDSSAGTTEERAMAFRRALSAQGPPLVAAVNYEAMWRGDLADAFLGAPIDVLILDECHRIKGASSEQSKFCKKLGRVATYRWGLSGTPLAHSPVDAYAIFRALDPAIFGTSLAMFRANYCIMGGFGGKEVKGYTNLEEFRTRFYSITLEAERDVLDLPDAVHVDLAVTLPRAVRKIHDDLHFEAVAYLKESGKEILASNVLTRLLRMAQVASGHVGIRIDEDAVALQDLFAGLNVEPPRWESHHKDVEVHEVHTEKLSRLAELLEDLDPAEPVVVFCRFRHDLTQVGRAANTAERAYYELSGKVDQLSAWRDSKGGAVLGVQIQSGGEGIDLTKARYAVYYDLPFSLSQFEQSLARIHRPGQTRSVAYYYLLASGTVDDYIRACLNNRRDVIERVLTEGVLVIGG